MTIGNVVLTRATLGSIAAVALLCVLPLVIGIGSAGALASFIAPLEVVAVGTAVLGGSALLGRRLLAKRRSAEGESQNDPGGAATEACKDESAKTTAESASAQPACELDAIDPDERGEHERNAERVFSSVEEVRETSGGYAFRLPPDPETLAAAGSFVARERLCCPFFTFALTFEADRGPAWLELSGDSPVKEYIRDNVLPVVRQAQGEAAS